MEETIVGTDFDDSIIAHAVQVRHGDDNRILQDVLILAGDGDDHVMGSIGNDTIYGEAGDDTVIGGAGEDYVFGGSGSDTMVAGQGDTLDGGEGFDSVFVFTFGWDESELVFWDRSDDLIRFADPSKASVELVNVEDVFSFGDVVIRELGNAEANWIVANDASNMIYGLEGNDTIFGEEGHDTVIGGSDDDFIVGGDGDDILIADGVSEFALSYIETAMNLA